MTGVAYIPIEKKSRELAPKLLVASELAARGVVPVVGFARSVFANMARFPQGVVYFKGMNRVQVDYMRHVTAANHVIVATDEEALGARGPLLAKDTWHEARSLVRAVFCQGAEQAEVLAKTRGFEADQLRRTGNPRIDLLRARFSSFWADQARELKAEQGRFVLVNTDMSSVNAKNQDLAQYKKSLVQIGWLDPESEADRALMEEHIEHDRENLSAISDFVLAMDQEHREIPIVIRPHPGEDPEYWRGVAARCANVQVVTGSEPVPWLLAATCLVQAGCTTGVEATVLGTPSISLIRNPSGARFPDYRITNSVNPVVGDVAAAVDLVGRLFDGAMGRADPAEARRALAPFIDIDDTRFAYENIADEIEAAMGETASVAWRDIQPLAADVDQALRRTVRRPAFEDGFSSREDVEARLQMLSARLGRPAPAIKDLGWGVYALEPARGMP